MWLFYGALIVVFFMVEEFFTPRRKERGNVRNPKRAVDKVVTYLWEVRCLTSDAEMSTKRVALKLLKEAAINLQWAIEVLEGV